ncbi:hypothetical protein Pint_07435 [Pistacia integerrima]|uniref:Uncharacterized protein n=1 Tax=Pistacia integerrima TaxID=434235 RepID=A0ACC0XVT7_9ROSI|nr:hypothetical protein Pint_07435 [Pistacia integerrima]
MPKRNVVSYNLLISAYTQMGFYNEAINLFNEARMEGLKLDKFTYAGAIVVCGQTEDLELGKLVHGIVIVGGLAEQVFVINSLIDMYCKCGEVDQARLLFEKSSELDDVSWNSLISGYVRIGAIEEALGVLVKMHRDGLNLNTYTLGCALKACSTNFDDSVKYGRMLHGYSAKLGLDIVSDDSANRAFNLFSEMQRQGIKASKFTFSIILKACNIVEAFEYGKQIHAQIYKRNLSDEFIGSALVELYSLLGSTEDGMKCFNLIPKLDIVSWTSMISGHVRNKQFESALALFHELLSSGEKADEFLLSTMLVACADLAAARSGEQLQGYGIKSGTGNFTVVQNSLICMYAKSGDRFSANKTFEEIKNPDTVS